jgi:NAD(P) transhydrogenase subunit beta
VTPDFLPKFLVEIGWVNLAYLVASVLFILGIKGLTHPRTAVRGNLLGALGMLLAVLATFLAKGIDFKLVLAAIALGSIVGIVAATKVQLTAMPQLVALFNGFGGAASTLVAGAVLIESHGQGGHQFTVATAASGLFGTITFTGSLIAFAKLQELMTGNAISFPGQKFLNVLLALAAIACSAWVVIDPANLNAYWALCAVAGVLGVTLVIPIGGADMPVVIALLNSYSGLAAAATGFV